jgi:hypothetical protein
MSLSQDMDQVAVPCEHRNGHPGSVKGLCSMQVLNPLKPKLV